MRFSCGSPAVDGCTPSTKFDMTITKIVRKFNKFNEAEKWGLVMDNLSLQDRIATGLCYCKDGDNCDACGLHLTILPRNEYEDREYQYYISEPPDVPSWKKGAPYRGYAGQHPETKEMVEWRTVLDKQWPRGYFGKSVYKAGYRLQEAIQRGKTLGEAEK